MKKKRFLALLLAMLTLGTFAACDGGNNESSSGGVQTEEPPASTAREYDLSSCVHEYNVTETDVDFFKDGTTSYAIVYPAEEAKDEYVLKSISELQKFIFEATGKMMPAYTDVEKAEATKILSLGKTNQAEAKTALMETVGEYSLGRDGYVIQTHGDSVYVVGKTSHASLYGAYEFLHWQFNYESYDNETYKIDRNVTDMKLKDFDIVDIPDFESRTPTGSAAGVTDRLRTQSYTAPFNSAMGNVFCHNYFELIGADYLEKHPKWLATTPTQLCLNAKGDAEERQALIDAVVHEMIIRFEAQPNIDWMVFSHEDGGLWCSCPACTEESSKFDKKSNSAAFATVIRFINEVAVKIKAWNKENCPERDLRLFIYNYGFVRYAPVKVEKNSKGVLEPVLDEDGNYQPYSEDLILDEIVGIYLCGFNSSTYLGLSQYEERSIEDAMRCYAVMKNPLFYIWAYSAHYNDYLVPYHITETRQDYYQYFKSLGAVGVLDLGQYANNRSTDFGEMKSYISAKLLWNVQLDVQELIADFIANYYGLGGEIMAEMYADYRGYMQYQINEKGNIGKPANFFNKATYTFDLIKKFQNYVDRALAAIEPLKAQNATEYEATYKRIKRERISWDYLMASLHSDKFSSAELERLQRKVITDAQDVGIIQQNEWNTIDNLFGIN